MEYPLRVLRQRDRKESDLLAYHALVEACDQDKAEKKKNYKKKLEEYATWKEENKIAGIRF